MDTIFALATARGKAGVAVVRVSGPQAHDAVVRFCGDVPSVRKASVRMVRDEDDAAIDEALVLIFEEGASFTGEPVAEFHLHGSMAIVARVLKRLGDMPGLRLADPGEFTRRALENERLDLSQVEGLGDLIEAETEAQRHQAMRVFSGALGAKVESWRADLVRAAALLEATIDFADEDVPIDVVPEVTELLDGVLRSVSQEVVGASASERIRDGFEVAIVGPPNVGKSTLLNRLAGRDAAITSEIAGTTRDVIEVRMDLGGLPVTILDTAGVRETDDTVESLGIDRTMQRAQDADLRIFLLAEEGEVPALEPINDDLVVLGKSDLRNAVTTGVSGLTGAGVDDLVVKIRCILELRVSGAGVVIRERHRIAMERSLLSLRTARTHLGAFGAAPEIVAEELRSAIIALESLVGRVDVEHILEDIFASFCIGK